MKCILTTLALLLLGITIRAQCPSSSDIILKDTIIICADTTFILTATNEPSWSYDWSTGENTPNISIDYSGKYWVTVNAAGCPEVTDTVTIIFNSLLQQPVVRNEIFCFNQPAAPLKASGENLSWYTSPTSPGGSPNAPVPSTADTGTTYYYVSQTIAGCESPRARLTVEVINKPLLDLGEDILIPCGAKGVVLQTVEQKYTGYLWQDGSADPEFLATESGIYILKAHNICGSHTDSVQVVLCNTHCVSFPTAFTPNQDGLNDSFRPGVFCPVNTYRFTVFDRYGRKVFESSDPVKGWDGNLQGKKAPSGSYVYYCVYYDFILKRELMLKGSVTLIR